MTSTRWKLVLPTGILLAVATLGLASCSFLEPTPVKTPSPTESIVDPSTLIGGVIDPAGTTWIGRDSGGDDNSFTLNPDGTVSVAYGTNSYSYPGDTWYVRDGILRMEIYLDETNGLAEYVGTWDAETATLNTVMRTTKTAKELTVALTQAAD
ncbi:MAG: hypothetical protein KF808_02255 [Cryobacterium sp.]|nr:hypothetical protein [Cryobacterium sp.]